MLSLYSNAIKPGYLAMKTYVRHMLIPFSDISCMNSLLIAIHVRSHVCCSCAWNCSLAFRSAILNHELVFRKAQEKILVLDLR